MARGAQSMQRHMGGKRGLGVLANQSDSTGRRTRADAVRFEQHDRHAGGGEAPRGGRTGESATDNDDPGVEMIAKTGKRRAAASGEAIEPERLMPQLHAADPTDEATRAVILIDGRAYSTDQVPAE